MTGQATYI